MGPSLALGEAVRSLPRIVSDADVPWRWVLRRPDTIGPCTSVAGWTARYLFDRPEMLETSQLRRFCLYETGAAAPNVPLLKATLAGEGTLEPDRMVVVPLSSGLEGAVAPLFEQQFRDRAGEAAWPFPSGGTPPRLVIIDTTPDASTEPENHPSTSPHGHGLLNFAHALLCSGGLCLAELHSELGLAYVDFDPTGPRHLSIRDDALGGYLGTQSELAEAIVRAVTRANPLGARIVINLSVGWDPLFCQASPPSAPPDQALFVKHAGQVPPSPDTMQCIPSLSIPSVTAVHDALAYARCEEALVIAAAGNRTNGPSDDTPGAFLPAAWETQPAPDLAKCVQILGEPPAGGLVAEPRKPGAKSTPYNPLIYAAAGVNANGHLLSNARFGSTPPRVAYADHAVVEAGDGTPTATLTGSSTAALVVSASAVAVWRYRPTLSPHAVMAIVDESAIAADSSMTSGWTPDVVLLPAGASKTVQRIDVCSAVLAACAMTNSGPLGLCPVTQTLPTCPSPTPGLPPSFGASSSQIDVTDFEPVSTNVCGLAAVLQDNNLQQNGQPVLCPDTQFYSPTATPYVGPQPDEIVCPNCSCCSSAGLSLLQEPGFGKSVPQTELLVEIAPDAPAQLCAPTISTPSLVLRFAEATWPCMTAGSVCRIMLGGVDLNNEPIRLSFTVHEDGASCASTSAERWSLSSDLYALP